MTTAKNMTVYETWFYSSKLNLALNMEEDKKLIGITHEFIMGFVTQMEGLISQCFADAAVGSTPKPGKPVEIAKGIGEGTGAAVGMIPGLEASSRGISNTFGKVAEETTKAICGGKRKEECRHVQDYFRFLPMEERVPMWVAVARELLFTYEEMLMSVTGSKTGTEWTGIDKCANDPAGRIINHIKDYKGKDLQFTVQALVAAVFEGKSSSSSVAGQVCSVFNSQKKSGLTVEIEDKEFLTSQLFGNAAPVAVDENGLIVKIYGDGNRSAHYRRLLPWESKETLGSSVHNKMDTKRKRYKYRLTVDWLKADKGDIVKEFEKRNPEMRSMSVYEGVPEVNHKVDSVQELLNKNLQTTESGTKEVLEAVASGNAQISHVGSQISELKHVTKELNTIRLDNVAQLIKIKQQEKYEKHIEFPQLIAKSFTDWGTAANHSHVDGNKLNSSLWDWCDNDNNTEGSVVATYTCTDRRTDRRFIVEVIIMDKKDYNNCKNSFVLVSSNKIRTGRLKKRNLEEDFVEFQLTNETKPWCMLVGNHLLNESLVANACRIVVFHDDVLPKQEIENLLGTFASCDDPKFKFEAKIPNSDGFRVPLRISNTILVNKELYKTRGQDVFVFVGVSMEKVEELAGHRNVQEWSSRQTDIYNTHIVLQNESQWDELMQARTPSTSVHLFREKADCYELVRSTGVTSIVRNYSVEGGRKYMSLTDIATDLLNNQESKVVLICDKSGSGKSWLLNSVAREMNNVVKNAFVLHLRLRDWKPDQMSDSKQVLKSVLKNATSSEKLASTIFRYVKDDQECAPKLFFFMDACDEVSETHINTVIKSLLIIKNIKNVRLVITSAMPMRTQLEDLFGVVSYGIRPFDLKEKIDAITSHWGNTSDERLRNFAAQCLESITDIETETTPDVLGDPLKCWLLANVNKKYLKCLPVPLNETTKSIRCLYDTFVNDEVDKVVSKDPALKRRIMEFLMYKGLEMLNPKIAEAFKSLRNINSHDLPEMSKIRLLRKNDVGKLEFVHSSFACLFQAMFFAKFWSSLDTNDNQFVILVGKFFITEMLETTMRRGCIIQTGDSFSFLPKDNANGYPAIFKLATMMWFFDYFSNLCKKDFQSCVLHYKKLLDERLEDIRTTLKENLFPCVLACKITGLNNVEVLLAHMVYLLLDTEEITELIVSECIDEPIYFPRSCRYAFMLVLELTFFIEFERNHVCRMEPAMPFLFTDDFKLLLDNYVHKYYYGNITTVENEHLSGPRQEKKVMKHPLYCWEECMENEETWLNLDDDLKLTLLKYTIEYRYEQNTDIVRLIQFLFSPRLITTGQLTEACEVYADEILPTLNAKQANAIFTNLNITNFRSFANMNELETYRLFIGICPDLSEYTNTNMNYLHLAVVHGNTHVVKYLIEKGYNVNQPDHFGHTPFHFLTKNAVEITKLLLSNGGNLLAKNRLTETPAYSFLKRNLQSKHEGSVQMTERTEQWVGFMLDIEDNQGYLEEDSFWLIKGYKREPPIILVEQILGRDHAHTKTLLRRQPPNYSASEPLQMDQSWSGNRLQYGPTVICICGAVLLISAFIANWPWA